MKLSLANFIFAHDSNEAFTDHSARFSFTFKLRGFLLWEAGDYLTSINMVRMWIPGSNCCLNSPESLTRSHAYYLYNQKVLTMFEKQLDGQMAQEKRDNGYLSVKARWRFVFLNLDLFHPSTGHDVIKTSESLLCRFTGDRVSTAIYAGPYDILLTLRYKHYEAVKIYLKYLSSLPL